MKGRKIHVLQMIGEFTSGGAESVVVNLARTLDTNLVDLTYTARRNGPVSCELPDPSRLVIIPKRNGLDIVHLKRLIHLIEEREIDLIHAHLFGPNLFGFLAAKLTGKRIILTIHGRECIGTRKRVWAYRLMVPWVDQVVTVSDLLENEFRAKVGCCDSRLTTIHNGVNADRFNLSVDRKRRLMSFGLPRHCKIIGAVGNVKPVKGYDILMEALLILKQQGARDFVLVIVGEIFPNHEPYRKELDDFIKENDLEEQVVFLGYRQDVAEILPLFDLYVLASRSEGLSMSLLEAMTARKPVVVTDVGMNGRIIQNGLNGLLVPSESPGSLADAILRVLKDDDLARELASSALKTVQEKYSDKQMADKYTSLYKAVLSR